MVSVPKYSADDWLALNGLQRRDVLRLLWAARVRVARQERRIADFDLCQDVDEVTAWRMAADAIALLLPTSKGIIQQIRDEAPRNLSPRECKIKPAFVHDRGRGTLPCISCPYDYSPAGLLCVAHEFAHAVQIVASDHALMPPVAREVCAFLGEIALIDWLQERRPTLAESLRAVQREEDLRYLGSDADALAAAMRNGGGAYHYRWNYPVARIAARWMYRNREREQFWALFCSGERAPDLLPVEEIIEAETKHWNWLPPLQVTDEQPATIYRQLGALALLDLAEGGKAAAASIRERYANLSLHLRSGSVFIGLDGGGRPIGYVVWGEEAMGAARQRPAERHAPFGDVLLLEQPFRKNIPVAGAVLDHSKTDVALKGAS